MLLLNACTYQEARPEKIRRRFWKIMNLLIISVTEPQRFHPRKVKTHAHKYLHMNVHSSTKDSQRVEKTQMSISWYVDKQFVLHPCNGLILSPEKEWSTVTHSSMRWLSVWKHCSYCLTHIWETKCIPQTFMESPVRLWVLLSPGLEQSLFKMLDLLRRENELWKTCC